MKMYIGLDVHSKFTVYCAQDKEGKIVGQGKIPTTFEGFGQMKKKLKAPAGTAAALETGAQCFLAARGLFELGLKPVVIDAQEVRAKARSRRQKSDLRDAYDLCEGLRLGYYMKIVYIPPPDIRRLRQLLSRRRHFVRLGAMQINAAKFVLRQHGLSSLSRSLVSDSAWENLLGDCAAAEARELLNCHYQVWRAAKKQQAWLQEQLEAALEPFRCEYELLTSAPGVGPLTAATFIAVIATPKRFASSGEIVSYAGLAPSSYDSGGIERRGRITKQGSAELRSMLCEAAHHASRPTHPLNPYFMRVLAKGGYKKAVVAVAQRLARVLYQMWKTRQKFAPEKLNVEHKPVERKKMVYWCVKKADKAPRHAVSN